MKYSKTESLKNKLQLRYKRLSNPFPEQFHYHLRQFMKFITENSVYRSILDECLHKHTDSARKAGIIGGQHSGEGMYLKNEEENVAIGYYVVTNILATRTSDDTWTPEQFVVMISKRYKAKDSQDYNYYNQFFLNYFVNPIVDYIEERIDEQILILHSLRRFKHFSEWYRTSELLELYNNDTRRGEQVLKKELYKFLFLEGIECIIEPESASGFADAIIPQTGHKLIVEVKIFTGGVNTITKGFNQLYTYNNNYNEPFGYLILFKTCETDIKFQLKWTDDKIPYITYNNKTFYFIVIDILRGKTASQKTGLIAEEITEEMLITVLKSNKEELVTNI